MLMRCITCHEIIEGTYWDLESGYVACNDCYWKDFTKHLTPIIKEGNIKGPTREDFSLNFDRDPEWDNSVRIVNALEVIDSYQGIAGTQSGGDVDALVFSALDIHYMLNEIIEALEEE